MTWSNKKLFTLCSTLFHSFPEKEALAFRDKVIEAVKNRKFIVVCPGITDKELPGLQSTNKINYDPIGPHPCGSYEVYNCYWTPCNIWIDEWFQIWTPWESVAAMLSFCMLNRGTLSILVHPLGKSEVEDHTTHSMWLGSPFRLRVETLAAFGGDEPQYPELGLGYSAK